jgi:hypothetical protein
MNMSHWLHVSELYTAALGYPKKLQVHPGDDVIFFEPNASRGGMVDAWYTVHGPRLQASPSID